MLSHLKQIATNRHILYITTTAIMQLVGWRFMNFYIQYLYQSGTFHKPNGSFVKLRRVLIVSWNQIMVFVASYCGNSVLLDISVYQVFNLDSNFNDKFQIWHLPVFELPNLWNMVSSLRNLLPNSYRCRWWFWPDQVTLTVNQYFFSLHEFVLFAIIQRLVIFYGKLLSQFFTSQCCLSQDPILGNCTHPPLSLKGGFIFSGSREKLE